ncbi:thiol reductant ABC exporter subunit CydD [Desulfobotulus mexicanus]|uniref:Thiol reductant ABC exporter subunit CydD n=1 Tax=Desulfobotulus mexicanus TaxID=2586642 RepID=A0A5S5MEB7_9BACT|nr:thiol reductant ABC exporter subunit CydD [Desulfobotulus mexicanus]TYT74054.1 thiol reductant ABC exporter subunit CydD [Desulfobotulus mexicanus]
MKEISKDTEANAEVWLKAQVKRVQGLLFISALAGSMAALAMVFQCFFLADLLVGLALENRFDKTSFWLLGLCLLLRPLLLAAKDGFGLRAGLYLRRRLRRELLEKITDAGPHRSRIAGDGVLSAMVLEQVDAMDDYIVRYLPQKILAVVTPLVIVLAIWPHSRLVALLLLVTAPLIPFFMVLVGNEAARAGRKQFQALSLLAGRIRDLLRGLPVLRQLNAVEPAREKLSLAAEGYKKKTLSVLKLAFLSSAVLELFASLSIALVAVYLGMGLLGHVPWARGTVPVPLLSGLFILLLIPEYYMALRRLGADYHAKAQAMAAASSLLPLVKTASLHPVSGKLEWQPEVAPSIRMEKLSWRPDGRNAVIKDVDLHIQAGQRVGLVGPSGAGKSSILTLLLGFDRPSQGQIFVDDKPLETLDADTFRKKIAWLGQKPEWFSGTLGENLRLGRPDAPDTELLRVLGEAGALDFVKALPMGLNSPMGEGGLGFSGGQLQRLALARAILQDAPLWILDEPGAHLDPETAKAVRMELGRISSGKTLILATHHLEGLDWLDFLVHMDKGSMVRTGKIL